MYIDGAVLRKIRTYKSLSRAELAEILVTTKLIDQELVPQEHDPSDINPLEKHLLYIENNNGELPDEYAQVLAHRLDVCLEEIISSSTPNELNEEEPLIVTKGLKIPTKKTQVISITATKGGSTKTTSLTNLAAAFSEILGYNVLVIDTDNQRDTTNTFGLTDTYEYNFKKLYLDEPDDSLSPETLYKYIHKLDLYSGLSIIPSSREFMYIETHIATFDFRKERMQEVIAALKDLNEYDLILIDTNNNAPLLNGCLMNSSDYILIPTIPESYPVRCTLEYHSWLETTVFKYNRHLQLLGVALTRVEKINAHQECTELLDSSVLKEYIFESVVRKDAKIPTSQNEGHPAVCLYPKANVSQDYVALAKEVIKRIKALAERR